MTQADSTSVLGRSLEDAGAVPSPQAFRPYPAPAYSPLVHTPARLRPTVQEDPLDLPDPTEYLEAVPIEGCKICAALDKQRAEARAAGDFSKVSDCNVEIHLHPHKKGKS